MKAFMYLSSLLILGCVTAGCGDNAVTTPSPALSAKFTATLLPASEVPPVSGSEAGGSGTATLTFNLTRDSGGNTTAATMVLGVPFGGQRGFGIRPYGIVGIGAVKASGDAFNNLLSVSDYHVAWDAGGGVMMFFTTHVGIRGDVRYIRSLEAVDLLPATPGLELGTGHLDFTRASVGLVFRF